jgi:quinol monooxygenase YgiN
MAEGRGHPSGEAPIHGADGSIQNIEWSAGRRSLQLSSPKRGAPCAAEEEDLMTAASPTAVTLSLLARIEAKPGKEAEVEALLRSAVGLAAEEPRTIHWFALRIGTSTFGIFDTFADEVGRKEHLAGRIAAALMAKAPELLAAPPVIEHVDIIAAKG